MRSQSIPTIIRRLRALHAKLVASDLSTPAEDHAVLNALMVLAADHAQFPWCDACQSWHHPNNPTCRKHGWTDERGAK